MFWLALPIIGLCASVYMGKCMLYPRTRCEKLHDMKFKNGISYIYDDNDSDIVLLMSHGNYGDMTHRSYFRDFCKQNNFGCLLYDYYGYGASDDAMTISMSESYLHASILPVYKSLFDTQDDLYMSKTKRKKVILVGESLGCHPTCWLATHYNVDGVILFVPFDNLTSIAGIGALITGNHDNVDLCRKIKCPTVIFHATHDDIIPEHCASHLYNTLQCEKKIHHIDTGHNDYFNMTTQQILVNEIKKIVKS